ncbi:FAD-dependent oxidoreductase [Streptomyces sp. NPDC057617]|uniref:FAD-dependent oxidoreductase n=1 Tax=Streptomyces sp. NPDC057617 TaxID=3346184 RepID=UPI003674E032
MTISRADTPYDLAVLGAGPAGLAAAVTAAAAGARVALVDAGPRPGGQYWRHRAGDEGAPGHGGTAFQRLRYGLTAHADRIDYLAGHSVWHAERTADGFRTHMVPAHTGSAHMVRTHTAPAHTVGGHIAPDHTGPDHTAPDHTGPDHTDLDHTGRDHMAATHTAGSPAGRVLRSRTVVVATGAYDRQLPFPGWTLPGVFTAGGVQALLKGQGVVAGQRIAVTGTGPFLLAVAAGLAEAGARVVGVFEAGLPAGLGRHPFAVARNPAKLAEGADFLRTLLRHRVPYRTRTAVIAAHGDGEVTGATVARLDAGWRVMPGSWRRIDCDTLAVGYGFTPQTEIALQLGCATHRDLDGSLVATADGRQLSTVPGVYLAGEVCGVGGAALSVTEGELAGLHAAFVTTGAAPSRAVVRRLTRRRAAQRGFATALHEAYPVRPGWTTWLDTDTLVCRCEEVTSEAVTEAVEELGATDARGVKLYARPGMGLCQGRVCGYAVGCLVAARTGRAPTEDDLRSMAGRPVAQPLTLGTLAAGLGTDDPEPGLDTAPDVDAPAPEPDPAPAPIPDDSTSDQKSGQ